MPAPQSKATRRTSTSAIKIASFGNNVTREMVTKKLEEDAKMVAIEAGLEKKLHESDDPPIEAPAVSTESSS